jgi:hypothetical protein
VEKKKLFEIRTLLLLFIISFFSPLIAQQLNLPLNRSHIQYYEKYLNGADKAPFHTSIRPYNAAEVYRFVYPDSAWGLKRLDPDKGINRFINTVGYADLLAFDEQGYIRSYYFDSTYYAGGIMMTRDEKSYKPRKFYIAANPILKLEMGYDLTEGRVVSQNTRGVELFANIGQKVSLYTAFTENQADFPGYIRAQVRSNRAAPGEGKVKAFKDSGVDFSRAEGYIAYTPNQYFAAQFGSGKHFFGDGYRSLLLSDNSFVYPYLRFATSFWKIKYVNILAELQDDVNTGREFLLGNPRKFASFIYMNAELAPWFQLGIFEGIMWPRTGPDGNTRFDANMLNPILGVRAFQNNLEVNKVYGLNYKFEMPKYISLYGQVMINSLKGSTKSYERRWGLQAGVKYWDMFGVDNLNMQVEYNYIRPYSYSSEDTILHYSHYSQPIAHPMGANVSEVLSIFNYRYKRWVAEWRFQYANSSVDVLNRNYGSDIFKANTTATIREDIKIGQGVKYSLMHNEIRLGYILNPKINLIMELKFNARKYTLETALIGDYTSNIIGLGLSTNLYNYYYDFPTVKF